MSLIFFFSSRRRHTRLQGDWSSDVCSSDLEQDSSGGEQIGDPVIAELVVGRAADDLAAQLTGEGLVEDPAERARSEHVDRRSEERRVGKECRSRWWPYH